LQLFKISSISQNSRTSNGIIALVLVLLLFQSPRDNTPASSRHPQDRSRIYIYNIAAVACQVRPRRMTHPDPIPLVQCHLQCNGTMAQKSHILIQGISKSLINSGSMGPLYDHIPLCKVSIKLFLRSDPTSPFWPWIHPDITNRLPFRILLCSLI